MNTVHQLTVHNVMSSRSVVIVDVLETGHRSSVQWIPECHQLEVNSFLMLKVKSRIVFQKIIFCIVHITNVYRLCMLEKFFIIYKPETATLNSRDEFFNTCRHKSKCMRSDSWGSKLSLIFLSQQQLKGYQCPSVCQSISPSVCQ